MSGLAKDILQCSCKIVTEKGDFSGGDFFQFSQCVCDAYDETKGTMVKKDVPLIVIRRR